jgi:chromosome segregation ATPase
LDANEGLVEVNAQLRGEVAELRDKILQTNNSNEGNEQGLVLAEQSIQEKNATIANLRALLDKSVKSDERKQQHIRELQQERETLLFKLETLTQEIDAQRIPSPQQPAGTTIALQQANTELEGRNRQLQELLERSQKVYASLLQEHRKILGDRIDSRLFQTPIYVVFDSAEKTRRKQMSATAEKEARLVRAAYLRKVVLQFFSVEMESERATMVPLILELVGCTPEQISVVMRHRSRCQNLIAKTTGFFGF